MTPDALTRTIQLVLAPVVMISACSIFVGGLLAHYTNLSDRIRAMVAERLELLRGRRGAAVHGGMDELGVERLGEIDVELPELSRRHRLVHHSVLALYLAILVLVASMFLIAVATLLSDAWIIGVVLVLFFSGVLAMLVGVALVALEIRASRRSLEFEVGRVLGLGRGAAAWTASLPADKPVTARR